MTRDTEGTSTEKTHSEPTIAKQREIVIPFAMSAALKGASEVFTTMFGVEVDPQYFRSSTRRLRQEAGKLFTSVTISVNDGSDRS